MISFRHKGNFQKTDKFLKKAADSRYLSILEKYGNMGVSALAAATPVESGKTASSWSYEIHTSKSGAEIVWNNSNINKGVNIAIILQYGHGTGTGGYVQGRDYINPALKPIFDKLAEELWREVTTS